MKTPEQIANEVLNSIPVGQYSTTAQMIVAAIEADRAQRGYEVTVSYPERGTTGQVYVQPLPGESIVQAVIREGNAAHEWVIDDVVEVS